MIIIRCFLTWIPGLNWDNPILFALRSATDIYLDLFRKIIPPIGGFLDISPVIALFALMFIQVGVIKLAGIILSGLGMV
jgi:YggT family protein